MKTFTKLRGDHEGSKREKFWFRFSREFVKTSVGVLVQVKILSFTIALSKYVFNTYFDKDIFFLSWKGSPTRIKSRKKLPQQFFLRKRGTRQLLRRVSSWPWPRPCRRTTSASSRCAQWSRHRTEKKLIKGLFFKIICKHLDSQPECSYESHVCCHSAYFNTYGFCKILN